MITESKSISNFIEDQDKDYLFQKNVHSACTAKESQQKNQKSRMSGTWSEEEHIAYYKFVIKNRELFAGTDIRKKMRVFKKMSQSIQTRQTSQCKSHHQKIMKSNNNELIRVIEYGINNYSECFESNINRRIIKTLKTAYQNTQQIYRVHQSSEGLLIQLNSQLIRSYLQIF